MAIRLTRNEIRALLAAAGNVDPCMFTEDMGGREGDRQYDAWISGQAKLEAMLDIRNEATERRRRRAARKPPEPGR
jgi:hypothetical protein